MKAAFLLQIAAAGAVPMLAAVAADSIGAVNVAGAFRLNGHPAVAHATVVSGATVETLDAFGELVLAGGVHVVMAGGTEAQLYRDRLILRRGAVQLAHAAGYVVEAQELHISPEGNESASVTLTPDGLQVATVSGRARVVNATGNTAWATPGKMLRFDEAAEPANTPPRPRVSATAGNARQGPSPPRPSSPGLPSKPFRPNPSPPPNSNPFPPKPFPFQPPLSP